MKPEDYIPQMINALNQCFSAFDVHFCKENVLFVRDDAVEYGPEKRRVPQEQLVPLERFDEAFAEMLDGGPSWIHANAVPFGDGRFLITIAVGQKIGTPNPSLNVSYEPEKRAEIILPSATKSLVMAN